jgi:hypothetical protein
MENQHDPAARQLRSEILRQRETGGEAELSPLFSSAPAAGLESRHRRD